VPARRVRGRDRRRGPRPRHLPRRRAAARRPDLGRAPPAAGRGVPLHPAARGGAEDARGAAVTAASPTVLVVEDEPEIPLFVRTALGAEGYGVVEAESGERGATAAGTHKPDLAIVDLGLPDIDGVEVIRRIRAWSRMPIIVLSARAREGAK